MTTTVLFGLSGTLVWIGMALFARGLYQGRTTSAHPLALWMIAAAGVLLVVVAILDPNGEPRDGIFAIVFLPLVLVAVFEGGMRWGRRTRQTAPESEAAP